MACLVGDSAALYVALRQIKKQKKRMSALSSNSEPPPTSTQEEKLTGILIKCCPTLTDI